MSEGTGRIDVAVVGIGCRYPGGVDGPDALWRRLLDGTPTTGEVPADRWRPVREHSREHAAALERINHRGSFLDPDEHDVDGFDAAFFGISAVEAEQLDPQQRLALEVVWEALEDASLPPTALAGSDTAVWLGVGTDDHGRRLLEDLPHVRAWTGIGASLCGVPNRVSHALDLRGSSVAVDTACSSSLVAIHAACAALRAGESRVALAGGVMLMTGPGLTAVLGEAGATSPDGRSKPFDAAADGYGRGEGAGVVVLKRLADARADGDDVLAVIRGSAVRQDGRTDGIMAPHGAAQVELMRAAYTAAGVDPATVGYVEAHGTGTPAGDPMEAEALCTVLGRSSDAAPCRVGSVKSVLGHTEAAAGVAGLITAILALRHRHVPAMPVVAGPRADVDWAAANLAPAVAPADWPDPGAPRVAGVASYGYGGTIAHLVVVEGDAAQRSSTREQGDAAQRSSTREQGDAAQRSSTGSPSSIGFPLSAASTAALARQADRLRAALDGDEAPALADVATTLTRGRAHLRHRAVVTADDRDGLRAGLATLADDSDGDAVLDGVGHTEGASWSVTTGTARPAEDAVWVFSGHGAQWAGMARGLLDTDPAFTDTLDRIGPIYRAELGATPRELITADDLGGVDRIQAALVSVQLGLAASWRSRGATPAAVIGHSVGEIAAAVVAGSLDEDDGARLACRRSTLLPRVAGAGAMVLVDLSYDACAAELDGQPDVEAAIMAAPGSTVAAGSPDAVAAVAARWEGAGRAVRRVDSDVAFHTAQMAPLADELARAVADLRPRPPAVPLYTTVLPDARSITAGTPQDASYWASNLRRPVRFADAVTAALEDGHRTFLEVSAHPVVAHSVTEVLAAHGVTDGAVVPTLRRHRPEHASLAAGVATLHCRGVRVALPVPVGRRIRLPGVVWRRGVHRVERRPATLPGPANTLLGHATDVVGTGARVWTTTLHARTRPYPGRHPVLGVEIVPAAVTLVTYLAAAGSTAVSALRLLRPVVVADDGEPAQELQVVNDGGALRIASRTGTGQWVAHSECRADPDEPGCRVPRLDADRAVEPLEPDTVVTALEALGVTAMGFPWRVDELRRGDGVLVAEVDADPGGVVRSRSWACLLDAALSTASIAFEAPRALRMPTAVDRVVITGTAPPDRAVVVVATDPRCPLTVDVEIRSDDEAVLVRLDGLRYAAPDGVATERPELAETVYALPWRPLDEDPAPGGAPSFVVAGPGAARFGDVARLSSGAGDGATSTLVAAGQEPHAAATALLDAVRAARPGDRVHALVRGLRTGSASDGDAAVAGVARVLATELPERFGGVLDLDPDPDPDALRSHLARPGTEPVVSLEGTRWLAPRAVGLGHTPSGAAPVCRPDGTYLVTGGLGAVGLRVAAHLATRGARRLVLLGRTPMPPRAGWHDEHSDPRVAAVRTIEAAGATVFTVAADVTDADAVRSALAALPVPPVRGVVHAAGEVRSGAALDVTREDLDVVLGAKVGGATVLDALFPPGSLDVFALFSSCGPLLGLPGQTAYAAANGVLDGLAARRRAAGDTAAVSLAWTSWRGLGMAAAAAATDVELDARGSADLTADRALAALDRVLAARDELPANGTVAVLPVRTDRSGPRPTLLADLDLGSAPAADVGPAWADRTGADLVAALETEVRAAVGGVLGGDPDALDAHAPLGGLGVDSLLGATLRVRLEGRVGLALAPTLLWSHPSVAALAGHLAALLGPDEPEGVAAR